MQASIRISSSAARLGIGLGALLSLVACTRSGITACTDELTVHPIPGDTTLAPSQQFTAQLLLSSCGGSESVSDVFAWRSQDSSVARVDGTTGRVTAMAAGYTRLIVLGASLANPDQLADFLLSPGPRVVPRLAILEQPQPEVHVTSLTTRVVHSDPEILHGEPVFRGTRVPVASLFDWLEGGETLAEWLDNFPGVTREQAMAVLEEAKATALAGARSSR